MDDNGTNDPRTVHDARRAGTETWATDEAMDEAARGDGARRYERAATAPRT